MTTQAERRRMTRRSIVDAAVEAFDSTGTTDAPLDDIAAAAGVAKSTVMYHFGSRLGLLQHVALRIFGEARRRLTDDPEHHRDASTWVAELLRSQTDHRARVLQAIGRELTAAGALGDADPLPWVENELARLGLSDPDLAAAAVLQIAERLAYGLIDPTSIDDLAKRITECFR